MNTKLDEKGRQALRDLCTEAKKSQDYTLWLATGLENVLTEFNVALELLQGCLGDGGAISFPLYEGIEKFVGRHGD